MLFSKIEQHGRSQCLAKKGPNTLLFSTGKNSYVCILWAVVSAVAAFLTLGTHVLLFTHGFFSVFSDIVLFCVSKIN